jgi:hypothetical protein
MIDISELRFKTVYVTGVRAVDVYTGKTVYLGTVTSQRISYYGHRTDAEKAVLGEVADRYEKWLCGEGDLP